MNGEKLNRRIGLCGFSIALIGVATVYFMELIKEVRS